MNLIKNNLLLPLIDEENEVFINFNIQNIYNLKIKYLRSYIYPFWFKYCDLYL